MEFDLSKTREHRRLIFKKSKRNLYFDRLNLPFVRGVLLVFLFLPVLPILKSYSLSYALFWLVVGVFCFLLWVLGFISLKQDMKLSEITVDNLEFSKRTFRKYLQLNGWSIENDSSEYFYAYKYKISPLIVHHFFMQYEADKVIACSIYASPFPWSYFSSKRDLKILKSGNSSVSNKKRNKLDGTEVPPIR